MKILITEDDALTRKILQKSLSNAGFEIYLAKNAKEAISRLKSDKLDLVLIDIYMPGIDGIELIHIVRNDMKNNVPIAVITRDKSEEMVVKAFEAGADDFILKPFDDEDLSGRLLNLIEKYE